MLFCFYVSLGGRGRGKLSDVEHKMTVSAFCRRRLPVVMTRLKMSENVQAVRFLLKVFSKISYGG
jgi:U3 small nucleolar ribonucleoprotein protein IMP3